VTDFTNGSKFYYLPGKLAVSKADQIPEFELVQMRNTGQYVSGDQGSISYRNFVQIGIEMDGPTADQIRAAKTTLRKEFGSCKLEKLPLYNISCRLILIDPKDNSTTLEAAELEADEEEKGSGFWHKRKLFAEISNAGSQIVATCLEDGKLAMSISFIYRAKGVDGQQAFLDVEGPLDSLGLSIEDLLPSEETNEADTEEDLRIHNVRIDVLPIHIEGDLSDHLKKIDVDQHSLPKWSVLEVKCYSFQGLDTLNFKKEVQLRAIGTTGEYVTTQCSFSKQSSDLVTHHVQFPFAVHLDKPYEWRVNCYSLQGQKEEGNWNIQSDWYKILDITTP
jgi:hypothetical protein